MKLSPDLHSVIKTPIVITGVVLIIIYTAFLTRVFYNKFVIDSWHQLIHQKATSLGQEQAKKIEAYFEIMNKKLILIAQNSTVIRHLKKEDVGSIDEFKQLLHQQLPEMTEINLVSVASPYFEETQNFVGITLANNSIAGKQIKPTAIKLQDWQIVNATPVVDGEEIIGSLIVSFSAQNLHPTLNDSDLSLGKTELLQYTRGFAPQLIISIGSSDTAFQADTPIKGRTDWKLRYSPSSKLVKLTAKPILYFALCFFALLTLSLLLVVLLIHYELARFRKDNALDKNDLTPEEMNRLIKEKLPQKKVATALPRFNMAGNGQDQPISEVFRQYDIRGKANSQINGDFALRLGKTIGSDMITSGQQTLLIGSDGRTSSPKLKAALIEGVLSTGCHIIDVGLVPTPLLNFALATLDTVDSGVMVTASHNPAEDNGFKIFYQQQVISEAKIRSLQKAMDAGCWQSGEGERRSLDIIGQYSEALVKNIASGSHQFKVVIDCANGATGPIAPALFEALGCEVIPLYCDIDGTFPNHPPDPTVSDNLIDLITVVKHEKADLGLAFDGDGDRLVAITATGRIVWADELLMVFARDVISHYPGTDIVFDIKSTRRLGKLISDYGGNPIMWKTGHSNIRRKISEYDAPLGGEFSGHIFFNERWFGFDDGLYAAARLIEIISQRKQSLDEIIASFESSVATPELRIAVAENQKCLIVDELAKNIFPQAKKITIDGLRLEYPEGWALVRASNTSAHLTLRFEANDQHVLSQIQSQLKQKLAPLLTNTKLPF